MDSIIPAIYVQMMAHFDEEAEEEEEMFKILMLNHHEKKYQRQNQPETDPFPEHVIPEYSMEDFKIHFRMEKSTFETLLSILASWPIKNNSRRPPVPLEKALKICIWTLANQEQYKIVSARFEVSKSTVWSCVFRTCHALVNHVGDFIKWPERNAAIQTQQKWREITGLDGVVGAIDGCLFPISQPATNANSYLCRLKYHAMAMQGICTPDNKFIHVDVGMFGSAHDERVFQESDLIDIVQQSRSEMFPNDGFLIGGSAFPLLNFLIVPFTDPQLSPQQIQLNGQISSGCMVIEKAFSMLFSRFRRLRFIYMRRTSLIPTMVMAACIMHNVCIDNEDTIEIDLFNWTNNNNDEHVEHILDEKDDVNKRHELMLTI